MRKTFDLVRRLICEAVREDGFEAQDRRWRTLQRRRADLVDLIGFQTRSSAHPERTAFFVNWAVCMEWILREDGLYPLSLTSPAGDLSGRLMAPDGLASEFVIDAGTDAEQLASAVVTRLRSEVFPAMLKMLDTRSFIEAWRAKYFSPLTRAWTYARMYRQVGELDLAREAAREARALAEREADVEWIEKHFAALLEGGGA